MTAGERAAARPRFARERSAHRTLPWVALVLVFGAATAGAYWLVNSATLDVDVIEVYGAQRSDPAPVLAAHGLHHDAGLVWIKAGTIEDALVTDPWVAAADVRVVYPDTVEVDIIEHRAVAWVGSDGNWLLVSPNGAVLETASAPRPGLARAEIAQLGYSPGDRVGDATVRAAIDFLDAMTAPTTLWGDQTGLWADVGGVLVRLGRPEQMAEKAAIVVAILGDASTAPTEIDVTAPDRPAVLSPGAPTADSSPQQEVEGSDDDP